MVYLTTSLGPDIIPEHFLFLSFYGEEAILLDNTIMKNSMVFFDEVIFNGEQRTSSSDFGVMFWTNYGLRHALNKVKL